jgi:arylsulfatase A-like enzyme
MGYSAVRTTKAKYIEYRELSGMNELYDLESDPYEEHNLIASPAGASLLKDDAERAGAAHSRISPAAPARTITLTSTQEDADDDPAGGSL